MKKIFIIFILFLFYSCQKKENYLDNEKNNVKVYISKRNLVFPDTIYVDSLYFGFIDYGDDFDQYTKKVNQDDEISRMIDFNYTLDTILYNNDFDLEQQVKFRSPAFNVNKIELDPISIGEKGVVYIQGFIKDLVIFDTIKNHSYDIPLDGLEKKYFIRKKIVVIESNG